MVCRTLIFCWFFVHQPQYEEKKLHRISSFFFCTEKIQLSILYISIGGNFDVAAEKHVSDAHVRIHE